MFALEGLTSFFAAVALLALVLALRHSARARLLLPGSRELLLEVVQELQAPARLLSLYVVVRLLRAVRSGPLHPDLLHALNLGAHLFGWIGLLRAAEALLFALLRARGGQGLPRILRSLLVWAATFAIAAIALRIEYQFDLSSVFATSALLSVVLGFALQESLGNLFAGLTLNAEHPFAPGDYVTFGKWTGRVLDVGWRSTRLATLDEDELLVPNGLISREVVVNHSRPTPRRCLELLVRLDLDASPARCKQVLLTTVGAVRGVLRDPPPAVEIAQFHEDGVDYRLKLHTAEFSQERAILDQVHQGLWYGLRRAGIDQPYRQTTFSARERPGEAEERRRREHAAEAEDLLSRIDFVAALQPEARSTLAAHARFLEFGPGEAVVRQEEPGDTFYLVARGEVSVRVSTSIGEKEVARLQRGAFFGEMSLLTGEPRTATVVALGDAALLEVDREAFSRLFAADPGVLEELARVIAGRKAALASARARGQAEAAAEEPETRSLLARIRSAFGLGPSGAARPTSR